MIKIAKELEKLPLLRVGDIADLQGNLKDLTEVNHKKLLNRIKKHGFKYPLYIWFNNGTPHTLDGKQRHRVIGKEFGEDTQLPYIEVFAKDEKEAKKEILAISSDYGTVTKDGFDEFTAEWEDFDFKEIKEDTTFDNWLDVEVQEPKEDLLQDEKEISEYKITCNKNDDTLIEQELEQIVKKYSGVKYERRADS